jgi:acyl-CoA thioester hydrolase
MPNDEQRSFVAETTFHVRYAETDAMGIVHHSSYIVWFEEGRSTYARLRGTDYADFERGGHYLTVAEVRARYLKPMRYGTQVVVRCWLASIQSRALSFAYEIVNGDSGDVCVTGETRHICITHDGQVTLIPEPWKSWGAR